MPDTSPDLVSQLPEPILTELGRVIATWSHVEQMFDMLYQHRVALQGGHEAELDDPRLALMGQGFGRRVAALRQNFENSDLPDEVRRACDRALSRSISLRRKRDFLAHGVMNVAVKSAEPYEPFSDRVHLIFKSWRNQKPHQMVHLTLADMQKTRERMTRLWVELIELQSRVWYLARPHRLHHAINAARYQSTVGLVRYNAPNRNAQPPASAISGVISNSSGS